MGVAFMPDHPDRSLALLADIALSAGRKIIEIYYSGETSVTAKADESPVTTADVAAEKIILEGLAALEPDIPVIAEEQVAAGRVPAAGDIFFLVDPLDGTREFISRNGEFTVNIARIEHGRPVAGVVYAPALDKIYAGSAQGAWFASVRTAAPLSWQPIRVRPPPNMETVIVASRSHRDPATDAFVAAYAGARCVSIGSSLKFCLVATGEADIYPRFGRTMEWDTAAGHAVLLAAGGKVHDHAGAPLTYGKPGHENPGFIASA